MNYWTLFQKRTRQIGFGYTHYFLSSLGQTFFISVFVESFSAELGMENQGFSVLYAVATIGSSLTLPFVGPWLDKLKLRNFSLLNGIALAFFCLVVSLSQNRIMLLIGLYGLRLTGQGLMALTGSASMARNFDKERGKAISLSLLGLSTGETIMPIIGIFLINLVGWQHAWQILSIITLLLFVPIAFFIVPKKDVFHTPPLKNKNTPTNSSDKSRKDVLKDKRFYLLVANMIFTPFFITGMFIHHNLLAQVKGWDMTWIATCFIGYGITKTFTSLLAGPIIDRISAKRLFPFYLLPMAVGVFFLIVLGNNPYVALIYLCFMSVSVALMSVSATALWVELYGHTHFGAIKSMATTFVVFASAIGPLVIGTFLGNESYWQSGLLICIGIMLILSLSTFLALRRT